MGTIFYEPFFGYIETKSSLRLTDNEKQLIQHTSRVKQLRKRQYLLQEGDTCKYMAFVIKGAGKMYSISDSGQEAVIRLAIESWWLGDYESFNFDTLSAYNIEMVEDSETILFTRRDFLLLTAQCEAFKKMIEIIDRQATVAAQKRIHSAIQDGAKERFDLFANSYPELIGRFSQSTIAAYLGISAETLSRIRK